MPGPHDVIETDGSLIRCRCGKSWDCETAGESLARHRMHYGLETARDALILAKEHHT